MDDALIYAREIAHLSASINAFERLLATEHAPAERKRIEQSLTNLYATCEELRGKLAQVLSIKTTQADEVKQALP